MLVGVHGALLSSLHRALPGSAPSFSKYGSVRGLPRVRCQARAGCRGHNGEPEGGGTAAVGQVRAAPSGVPSQGRGHMYGGVGLHLGVRETPSLFLGGYLFISYYY